MENSEAEFKRIQDLIQRYDLNIKRSFDLMSFAGSAKVDGPSLGTDEDVVADDIMRAAVVFVHAAVDDMVRSIGRLRFGRGNSALLTSIPLVGGEKTTFNMSSLATHSSKTVRQVIDDSIDAYFDRRTFSSCTEVIGFLESVGVRLQMSAVVLRCLDELMKRRHRIVHQADFASPVDEPVPRLSSVEKRRFLLWTRAADALLFAVAANLAPSTRQAEAAEIAERTARAVERMAASFDEA